MKSIRTDPRNHAAEGGGCAIHGKALTAGCPGCESYMDDLALSQVVTERLANECPAHEWVELEKGVGECSRCGSILFSADIDVTVELIEKYLTSSPESES